MEPACGHECMSHSRANAGHLDEHDGAVSPASRRRKTQGSLKLWVEVIGISEGTVERGRRKKNEGRCRGPSRAPDNTLCEHEGRRG